MAGARIKAAMSFAAVALLSVLLGPMSAAGLHYEAPSDCQWTLLNSSAAASASAGAGAAGVSGEPADVALHCRLRTINSQFDQTNFSVVPRDHTVSLTIECSDSLLYQSFLHPHGFSHLHQLRQLSIDYCKLGQLGRGVFHGLRDLRSLAIRSHNDVWPAMNLELGRDALAHDVPQLERLDLSRNNVPAFRRQVFCDLAGLQVLNVSRNRLSDVADLGLAWDTGVPCPTGIITLDASFNSVSRLRSGALAPLSHLRHLKLDHNGLEHVDEDALAAADQLERLDLSVNALDGLAEGLLASATGLRELDLSNNSLRALPARALASQTHLEVLALASNRLALAEQADGLFDGLVRLVVLDLSHNEITCIRRALFKHLYSVQVVRLRSNAIESVEAGSFAALSNLHTLDLADNRLAFVESHYFSGLLVLNELRLSANAIVGLDADVFRNCSNLEALQLDDNRLERVPASFKTLVRLKTLDLSRNRIRFVNATALRALKNLVHLRLSANQIKTLRQASFPALAQLKSLDVSYSSLQSIERGALDALTGLEVLHLNANNLTSLENVVANLARLVRLNVSDNDLRWFDYAVLPTGLQWLDLHKNQVEELGNYLRLEAELKLETLDASYNRIAALGAGSLPHSVRTVVLSDNQISVIEPNTFADKANLSRVDLYANQLVTLNLNALRLSADVPVLPEFYLGGNPFQCDCDMEWLQRLNVLNNAGQYPRAMDLDSIYCRLSYGRGSRSVTPLVEATSSDFLCPYRTHCFALCHCCEFDACDCEMTCPANCSCYHDQSWSTNVVDCSAGGVTSAPGDSALAAVLAKIPMDATDVYLDGNRLGQLGQHAFIGKKNVRTLLLNSSAITSLHNYTFSGLKRLVVLHLDGNELSSLSGYEFEPLESLHELHLANNRLSSIHAKAFSHLRSLQVLDLSANRLARYDAARLTANPYLRVLRLADNPWSCQCDFVRAFRAALISSRVQVDDAPSVACSPLGAPLLGPANDTDGDPCADGAGPPIRLEPAQLADWWLLVAATLSLALVVLSAGVCLCCCRRQLRTVLFSQCGVRLCYRPEEAKPGVEAKPFDALVVYSAKDEALLKDTTAKLEAETYRLCLQHRMAEREHDLMAAAVASRRIVVLLTKSFVETEWAKASVRALLRSTWQPAAAATARPREHVVVVLAERRLANEAKADLDLHLLLKHSQVIEWSGRLRYSRLLLALPPPRLGVLECEAGYALAQHEQPVPAARHHHKLIHQRQLPTVPETI